jgi:hypothetical protein
MSVQCQRGEISRKVIIWFLIPSVILLLFVGWREAVRFKYGRVRADWMVATLPQIAGLSLTNADIRRELESLKASKGQGENQEWTGDHLLLMTNDQYLIYAFWHGFNSGFVDHLFLAHGSDGKWYYSTYHFCNHMAAVFAEEPPSSIAEFTNRYSTREFDGKSEACLQHTWP